MEEPTDREVREANYYRYRVLSEASFEALVISREGTIINCNDQAVSLLGYETVDELIGRPVLELVPPGHRSRVRQIITENERERYEAEVRRRDGEARTVEIQGRPMQLEGATVRVTALRDITDRKRAEAQVRFQAGILEHVTDAVIAVDRRRRITYWNNSAERLLQLPEDRALGQRLDQVVTYRWIPPDSEETLWAALRNSGSWRGELIIVRPDGEERYVSVSFSVYYDEHDRAAGLLAVMHDVTDRRQRESDIIQRAYHDSLTALPNRKLFLFRTWSAITSYMLDHGDRYAVLFLDLDRFKIVNDSLGHEAGDELLRMLSDRLGEVIRSSDTVGRLGGDEFGVLMQGVQAAHDAESLAERLITSLERPFALRGREIVVSASIGIVVGTEEHKSPEDVLRDADTAMYHAKNVGESQYAVFEPEMGRLVSERFQLETSLRRAIEQEELLVYYQPIVELQSGRLAGLEALVRWNHPERGILLPGAFIKVAEEAGMLLQIDQWVMRTACRQMQQWRDQQLVSDDAFVTVNCSSQMFHQTHLAEAVRIALADSGLPAHQLGLEITERGFLNDVPHAVAELERLKRTYAVRICMDDFGTGYSSLGLLHQLPIDILKIDSAFTRQLPGSEKGQGMAQAIVDLARTLNLPIVAEGIETEEQLQLIRDMGGTYGQGFHYGHPLKPTEVEHWYHSHRVRKGR